jgi:hypothetical protein
MFCYEMMHYESNPNVSWYHKIELFHFSEPPGNGCIKIFIVKKKNEATKANKYIKKKYIVFLHK